MRGITLLALTLVLPIVAHAEPASQPAVPVAAATPAQDAGAAPSTERRPLNLHVPSWTGDPDDKVGNDTTAYGWRDGDTTTVLGFTPRHDNDHSDYSQSIDGIRQDNTGGLFGLSLTLHQ